jgi:electron transport complex protein RnfA
VTDFLTILVTTVLVNNLLLIQLLGVSSLFAYSTRWQQALELALFTFVVLTLSASINGLLVYFLLAPLGLMMAQLVVYVLISGGLATLLSQLLKRHLPLSYRRNGLAFLLAGGNSAVIGVALLQGEALRPPLEQLAYSVAAGAAFAGLLLAFAALRQRLTLIDIPTPFRGPAVELLSLGILAMGLQAMAGLF